MDKILAMFGRYLMAGAAGNVADAMWEGTKAAWSTAYARLFDSSMQQADVNPDSLDAQAMATRTTQLIKEQVIANLFLNVTNGYGIAISLYKRGMLSASQLTVTSLLYTVDSNISVSALPKAQRDQFFPNTDVTQFMNPASALSMQSLLIIEAEKRKLIDVI